METIPQILEHSVRTFADRTALVGGQAGGEAYTYRRLGAAAVALAERLIARSVRKGTHVAFLCENRPEWAVGYFAVHLAGAVLVPLDGHLTAAELRAILHRDRAPLLSSRPCMALAGEATDGMAGIELAVLEDLLAAPPGRAAEAAPTPVGREVLPADTAVITFTSGTTSDSKGIVLTHRNIASNAAASARKMDIRADDRLVSILPLSHLFEQTGGMLTPLLCGASVAYPGSLNPRAVIETMSHTRATLALVVPAVARLFRKRILSEVQSAPAWRRGLFRAGMAASRLARRAGATLGRRLFAEVHEAFGGHVRFFVSGGGPLDDELAAFFMDLGLPVLQGYGLVEAAPVVACNTVDDHVIGSVGRPLPGVEVRIDPVDSAGDGVGDGVGEILIRGPNVMAGYYRNAEATAETLQDGWLRTGDIGRIDRRGYLYVVGRIKDVIVGESGKNVYPAEIEQRIGECPCVREVCVLGVRPDNEADPSEQVAALVVPNEETLGGKYLPQHEEAIRREVRKACIHLAGYKRPRYFAVWPGELPRTTTMKVKKHQVRKDLRAVRLKRL